MNHANDRRRAPPNRWRCGNCQRRYVPGEFFSVASGEDGFICRDCLRHVCGLAQADDRPPLDLAAEEQASGRGLARKELA